VTSPGRGFDPSSSAGQVTVTGMMAAADLRRGDVVAGRYRVERLLGMGGMGVVYLAHDEELDIDIALKLLRPELASRPEAFERFRQELLLARQVSSPHVVRIHDLVRHGQTWLISMDYVPGQSLEQLLDTEGPLSPDRAIDLTRQLALGLAAAHHRGVVHRDLKPANVLLAADGAACITDFGVARSAGSTGMTGSGVIIGTPEYLSPEQARAETLDGRSDLYALGLILHEMLTGTLPFRGGTPAEMLAQRIVRDPPLVDSVRPDVPAFAVQLCARLLELRIARRFQSADDVVRAIDQRHVPGLRPPQRRGLVIATVAMVAGVAGAVGWTLWRATPSSSETIQATADANSVDLVPLPLALAGGDGADADLAAGIGRRLADSLADAPALRSADPLRVSRALTELGYDADAAQRNRGRVLDVLKGRRVLEGAVARDERGVIVTLALRDAEATASAWTAQSDPADDAGLPAALAALQQRLHDVLEIDDGATPWPSTDDVRIIGRYQREAPDTRALDEAIAAARTSVDPTLWWSLQESLDRNGRTSDAVSVARMASDALASDSSMPARRARAYALVLLGQHAQAIETLAPMIADVPGDHPLRVLQARAHGEDGAYDDAQRLLLAVSNEDPRNIDAWYLLGKYSIQAGDAKRAVDDYLVRAQVLANRLGDRRMQADVSNALGIGYRRLGQMEPAGDQLEAAVRQRGALGDARGQAASLRNLATVRSMQGRFDDASQALDGARTIIEPLGDAVALADLANDAGVLEEERGDHRAALVFYRDALRLRQSQDDARLIGESLVNVGFAYYQIGEFDNAQTYWQQAANTYGSIDDRTGVVHATQSLGLAEIARGDWAAARRSLEGSLAESEALQMAEERTISLAGLAELDRLEGRIDDALRFSASALAEFQRREDPRGIVEMQLLRSATFCDVGDWDSATNALDGLAVDTIANGEQASLMAWRLGEIALGHGRAAEAITLADDAIARAQQAHAHGAELSAHVLRARALAMLDRSTEAARELAHVEDGFERHASVPVRLLLAEAELVAMPAASAATYREARTLLARLPSYGRAFALHAAGAAVLQRNGSDGVDGARLAARESYSLMKDRTPVDQHPALAKLAVLAGIDTDASP
jgi:tetratricopeptide (TPR) repeat protein